MRDHRGGTWPKPNNHKWLITPPPAGLDSDVKKSGKKCPGDVITIAAAPEGLRGVSAKNHIATP